MLHQFIHYVECSRNQNPVVSVNNNCPEVKLIKNLGHFPHKLCIMLFFIYLVCYLKNNIEPLSEDTKGCSLLLRLHLGQFATGQVHPSQPLECSISFDFKSLMHLGIDKLACILDSGINFNPPLFLE